MALCGFGCNGWARMCSARNLGHSIIISVDISMCFGSFHCVGTCGNLVNMQGPMSIGHWCSLLVICALYGLVAFCVGFLHFISGCWTLVDVKRRYLDSPVQCYRWM